MNEFVECNECGFVMVGTGPDPEPKHWEECPGCSGTDFGWPE